MLFETKNISGYERVGTYKQGSMWMKNLDDEIRILLPIFYTESNKLRVMNVMKAKSTLVIQCMKLRVRAVATAMCDPCTRHRQVRVRALATEVSFKISLPPNPNDKHLNIWSRQSFRLKLTSKVLHKIRLKITVYFMQDF